MLKKTKERRAEHEAVLEAIIANQDEQDVIYAFLNQDKESLAEIKEVYPGLKDHVTRSKDNKIYLKKESYKVLAGMEEDSSWG